MRRIWHGGYERAGLYVVSSPLSLKRLGGKISH